MAVLTCELISVVPAADRWGEINGETGLSRRCTYKIKDNFYFMHHYTLPWIGEILLIQ